MSLSRYRGDPTIRGGRLKASARTIVRIRRAIREGRLRYRTIVITENQRLDKIAGQTYGDGRMWWILAAASGIGWCLQVPPGTMINVPIELGEVMSLI